MRLHLDLFADPPVVVGDGIRLTLASTRLSWRCADGALAVRIIACEPLVVPVEEASEPMAGAIGRLVHSIAGQGALLLLERPADAFGLQRIAFAEGVRLFDLRRDEDIACWDAALTLGLPVYGVRGDIVVDVLTPHPASVLSSLAYGLFYCRDGLDAVGLDERRDGVRLELDRSAEIAVVVRGGFEAERHAGSVLDRLDQGNEGYVRLHARDGDGQLWTQPRFIAPRHG